LNKRRKLKNKKAPANRHDAWGQLAPWQGKPVAQ